MYAKHTVQKYPLFVSANTLQGTLFVFPANALPPRDNLLLEVVSMLRAGNILEPGKKSSGGKSQRLNCSPAPIHHRLPPPAPLRAAGDLVGSLLPQARSPGEKLEPPAGSSSHV